MSGRHAAPISGRHAAVPRFARQPSRLTLRIAAVAVAAGIVAGVAATVTPGPGSGSTSNLAAINRAGSASAPGNLGSASAPGNVRAVRRGLAVGHPAAPTRQGTVGHATVPAKPYLMYDSVEPTAIPPGHVVATYTTGPYTVPPSVVAGRQVLWIDTRASDPSADALDIEPSDATPQQAATWAQQKLTANPHALAHLYTSQGEWPAVRAAVAATVSPKLQPRVRWWIADPTGHPHLVPGSDATQWYWGSTYDISTVTPHFGPLPAVVP